MFIAFFSVPQVCYISPYICKHANGIIVHLYNDYFVLYYLRVIKTHFFNTHEKFSFPFSCCSI
jgi:hypothetical protein